MSTKAFVSVATLLFAPYALAQPVSGDCAETPAPVVATSLDLCAMQAAGLAARIAEFQRLRSCSRSRESDGEAQRLAEEIGELSTCATKKLLDSTSAGVQAFLYDRALPLDRGAFRTYRLAKETSNYVELAKDEDFEDKLHEIPKWYLEEAAFRQAIDSLASAARDHVGRQDAGSPYFARYAKNYALNSGLPATDPRVAILAEFARRAGTRDPSPFPAELLRAFTGGVGGIPSGSCFSAEAVSEFTEQLETIAAALDVRANGFDPAKSGLHTVFSRSLAGRIRAERILLSLASEVVYRREVLTSPPEMREIIAREMTRDLRARLGTGRPGNETATYRVPPALFLGGELAGQYGFIVPGAIRDVELHAVSADGRLEGVPGASIRFLDVGDLPARKLILARPEGERDHYQVTVRPESGPPQIYDVFFGSRAEPLHLPRVIRLE